MRISSPLNQNWSFAKAGEEAILVNIPHTYNAVDGQDGSRMYRGDAAYCKTWTMTEAEASRHHYLEVGASALESDVIINGSQAYHTRCGFSMYRVALDDYLKVGENTIEIRVTNRHDNSLYPAMADFSFYGGVYREVRMVSDDAIHFCETDESRDGIILFPEIDDANTGSLKVKASITKEADFACCCQAKCVLEIKTPDGQVVMTSEADAEENVEFNLTIADAHRWDGLADPFLYTAVVSVKAADGTVFDSRSLEFGFRTVDYCPEKGFLLNGRPYQLKGVARHQDFGGLGNAITRKELETDLALIMEIGANSVRSSHYQHMDEWYTMCDRAGLLVWAEVPVISAIAQKKAADQNAFDQLRKLIAQARNHTSIYCWGVQNEVAMMTKNEYSFDLTRRLAEYSKELDPSRMTAQANEHTTESTCPINDHTDILGYNLYFGWYYGEIPDLQYRLDDIRAAHPTSPIILTEHGVDTNPRFHSLTPHKTDYTEEYQLLFLSNAIKTIEERPWMAGSYVWAMFDFGSAGRNEGGTKGKNQKGLVTADRKLKKDAFYLYKATWSKEPFAYIAGRRFINRPQTETDITVLSNLTRLQLIVNGVMVEEKTDITPMTVFEKVALVAGENKVEVVGWDADLKAYSDAILVCSVEEPDPSYVLPVIKTDNGSAVDWFKNVDPSLTEEYKEKPLRPEGFTLDSIVGDIYNVEGAKAVFLKYLAPLSENPRFEQTMDFISVRSLIKFSRMDIPETLLKTVEVELNAFDAPVEEE